MSEEEKPKQLVKMSTVLASGIAAIFAALFTSRLGVTGTLIGTALTPMLMTLAVAVLNAQLEKASTTISKLPNAVQGRLSGQQVRAPRSGSNPEQPDAETHEAPERRRERRAPGPIRRLLSIPSYLGEMAPSVRHRVLLTGGLSGLLAAAIGLSAVTGVEAATDTTFSCAVWEEECAQSSTATGEATGGSRPSIVQAIGGTPNADDQTTPSSGGELPAGEQQEEGQPAPGAEGTPRDLQYEGVPQGGDRQQNGEAPDQQPAEPAPQEEQLPDQEPGPTPQDGDEQAPEPVLPAPQQPAASTER
jgi:hypothetical protein